MKRPYVEISEIQKFATHGDEPSVDPMRIGGVTR